VDVPDFAICLMLDCITELSDIGYIFCACGMCGARDKQRGGASHAGEGDDQGGAKVDEFGFEFLDSGAIGIFQNSLLQVLLGLHAHHKLS
jgi:hypothetical protein